MIKESRVYDIQCDCCGCSLLGDDIVGYEDCLVLFDLMDEQNWIEKDNKDYCPDCYEYNDDGQLVIRNTSVCVRLWEWLQADEDGDWQRFELYRFLDIRHGRAINVYVDHIKFYEDIRNDKSSKHDIPFTKQMLFKIIKK